MTRINFLHLRYFWVVAREGSITAAANALKVTQPTVSTQVQKLETAIGAPLLTRHGNRIELTETGRLVQDYAAEIFALSDSMVAAVRNDRDEAGHRLAVGIVDSLPLLSVHRLLEPALMHPDGAPRVDLRVGKRDRLLAALASRTVDLVLSDSPAGPTGPVRAAEHLLVDSPVAVFGTAELARSLSGEFPACLDGAPFLVHTKNTPLRRGLDTWLARKGLRPRVVGEVEEVALLQLLGRAGMGLFVAPTLVEEEIRRDYGVEVVGRLDGVVERFFGLTLDDGRRNPAVARILGGPRTP